MGKILEAVIKHNEVKAKTLKEALNESKQPVCPHCGKPVIPSEIDGYVWECVDCDEDFYDFECPRNEGLKEDLKTDQEEFDEFVNDINDAILDTAHIYNADTEDIGDALEILADQYPASWKMNESLNESMSYDEIVEKIEDDFDGEWDAYISVSKSALYGFFADHEQAEEDLLNHYGVDSIEKLSVQKIMNWCYDHDQLYQDLGVYIIRNDDEIQSMLEESFKRQVK